MSRILNAMAFVGKALEKTSDRAFLTGLFLLVALSITEGEGVGLLIGLPFILVSLICEAIERRPLVAIIKTGDAK